MYGLWFGFRRNNVYTLRGEIQETQFLSEDATVISIYIHLRTMEVVLHVAIIKEFFTTLLQFFVSKEFTSFCVRSVFLAIVSLLSSYNA